MSPAPAYTSDASETYEVQDNHTNGAIHPNNVKIPHAVTHPSTGRTLLPGPIATLVSGITGASSLSVRVGSKIGGFWIAGAREATLTGLELTRAAVEAVLTTAGRDVSQRRKNELGRAEAEGVLERSVRTPGMAAAFNC